MDLRSPPGMYASEMVLSRCTWRCAPRIAESVPQGSHGRLRHHKRAGLVLAAVRASWINLRAGCGRLRGRANFSCSSRASCCSWLGLLLTFPLRSAAVTAGPITFALHWMLLGVSLANLGLHSCHGIVCCVLRHTRAPHGRLVQALSRTTHDALTPLFVTGLVLASLLLSPTRATGSACSSRFTLTAPGRHGPAVHGGGLHYLHVHAPCCTRRRWRPRR